MESLYWKIYVTGHIINNEFYLWSTRDWIVENKGHLMNWAKGATTIAQEKTQRVNSGSLGKTFREKINLSDGFKQPLGLGTSLQPNCLTPLDVYTYRHVGYG